MLGINAPEQTKAADEWIGPAPWIVSALPGPQARAAIERDHQVTSPSYTRAYPLVVRRAHGSVIEDVDGNRFLDFAAGIAVCAAGHTHPKVVAAIEGQARRLIHVGGTDFYYEPMIALCEKLAAITPGRRPKRVVLSNSGAEAIEVAIKLARRYTSRPWIIAFQGAFHGRTTGALSLTASKAVQRDGFGPLLPMVAHVPFGDASAIDEMVFKRLAGPGEVAAVFVEPVLGEGGYVLPPPNFLPRLRSLCDKHDILMVCDEIQSGIGRTGKWFACQHFGVVPDMVVVAKALAGGLPLGAVVALEPIVNWPPGAHGSTFAGNPISCAAALATLDTVETGYMTNAAALGTQLCCSLRDIAARRKCLANARGLGLMCAVDVVHRKTHTADPKLRARILGEAFSRGLVLLPCGEHAIRFCPPLCINRTQLEVGLQLFEEAIATVSP